jgi:hypothetical protein
MSIISLKAKIWFLIILFLFVAMPVFVSNKIIATFQENTAIYLSSHSIIKELSSSSLSLQSMEESQRKMDLFITEYEKHDVYQKENREKIAKIFMQMTSPSVDSQNSLTELTKIVDSLREKFLKNISHEAHTQNNIIQIILFAECLIMFSFMIFLWFVPLGIFINLYNKYFKRWLYD